MARAALGVRGHRDCCEDGAMTFMDTALLDALADCLESGDSLAEALAKVAMAGGVAGMWAERIRRSVRADVPLAALLRRSNVIDESEHALLSAEGADHVGAALLRVVATRRRWQLARRRSIQLGLLGPFGVAVLTVILDPIPNLVSGGPYVWPVFRGLALLAAVTLAIVVGIPALLRDPRARHRLLRLCAAVPGVHWLAALHAEEEMTTALVPFVVDAQVTSAGLTAASAMLAWSPIGEAMRAAGRVVRVPEAPLPMGGLEPLARQMSLATNLAVVGGVASKRLAERLTQRGEAISVLLTARTRLVVRVGAYAIIVLFSVASLASMVARGLPGIPTLPGAPGNADQKQLEELMKQIEQQ